MPTLFRGNVGYLGKAENSGKRRVSVEMHVWQRPTIEVSVCLTLVIPCKHCLMTIFLLKQARKQEM